MVMMRTDDARTLPTPLLPTLLFDTGNDPVVFSCAVATYSERAAERVSFTMDPISITASVITLAEAVAKVHRFLQSIRHADAGYDALCNELYSLTGFSQSIAKTLQGCQRHPLALAPIDEDVWKQSRNAITDSQQTIDDLNALVKRIGGPARSNTIFRRTRIATAMCLHTREIIAFRDKIHMANLSLQTLLQVINV
jgi:hypothetical protein